MYTNIIMISDMMNKTIPLKLKLLAEVFSFLPFTWLYNYLHLR